MTSIKYFIYGSLALLAFSVLLPSCNNKPETIKPIYMPVSEAVYASGSIKSDDQYQAYAAVSGIIEQVFVKAGDTVKLGQPLAKISNAAQKLRTENAGLEAQYADYGKNKDKLADAAQQLALAQSKMRNDSALYFRQKALWEQQVGTKVELEQRQLAYEDAKTSLYSARVRYNDLNRQLRLASMQAQKNLQIATEQQGDYVLASKINGRVYDFYKEPGEQVNPQTAIALIGRSNNFLAQMQVDEHDITRVKTGQLALITMDSYKDQVFEARVIKIYPVMDERSRTFLVEARFVKAPPSLYPKVSFEANIVIESKQRALLIPRNYVINDSLVINANKDTIKIRTGLKDYKMIEVLSGLTSNDELIKP